jgi:magnesium chelatase family protein
VGLGRTRSVALLGLRGAIVEVEADISSGLPKFILIGLPDAALKQAEHRVHAAAINSGCELPTKKYTVNLSPAALPKFGSGFDLSIAISCLAAAGTISAESIERVVHLGELGLDGRLRPIVGILPAVLALARAGYETVMVPTAMRMRLPSFPASRSSALHRCGMRPFGTAPSSSPRWSSPCLSHPCTPKR